MVKNKEKEQIYIARKYGITPGTLKCEAFALFDAGTSLKEVRYLLRHFVNRLRNPRAFASTIRRYHLLWKSIQG